MSFFKFTGLCFLVASAVSAPSTSEVVREVSTVIPILSQSEEVESNGTYKYSYETGNGIKREESSYDKVLPQVESRSALGGESNDSSDEIHVQQGSYSYTAPDGTVVSVSYIADENGFQPIGSHIPTAPSAISIKFGTNEKSGRALSSDSSVSASELANKIAISANDKVESNVVKTTSNGVAVTTQNNAASTINKESQSSESSAIGGANEVTAAAVEESASTSTVSTDVSTPLAETSSSETSTISANASTVAGSSPVTDSSIAETSTTATESSTTEALSTPLA